MRNGREILSMDGRGYWRDNVYVERIGRSVKLERVYLKAYDSVSAARASQIILLGTTPKGPIPIWSGSRPSRLT